MCIPRRPSNTNVIRAGRPGAALVPRSEKVEEIAVLVDAAGLNSTARTGSTSERGHRTARLSGGRTDPECEVG